ncbi:hypothetical protein BGW42_002939 [Actinomortierella wolfii]|nr:hypothetical protein BGW42_002939 [Actinomortierella wolfii]
MAMSCIDTQLLPPRAENEVCKSGSYEVVEGPIDLQFEIYLNSPLCYPTKDQSHDSGTYSTATLSRVVTSDRGRVIRTENFLPKGTLLFRIDALSAIPDANHQQSHCVLCLQKADEASKISCYGGCGQVVYCSTQCRDHDYERFHRIECGFLAKWSLSREQVASRMVGSNDGASAGQIRVMQDEFDGKERSYALEPYSWDYFRLLMRILTQHFTHQTCDAKEKQEQNTSHGAVGGTFGSLTDVRDDVLQTAMDLIENRSSFGHEHLKNEIANAASALDAYQHWIFSHLPPPYNKQPKLSMDMLIGLICREECNAFGIYDYPVVETLSGTPLDVQVINRKSYGLGLYTDGQAARFNHSCAPNLYHVFKDRHILVYAGRDIQPMEELSIAYLEFGGRIYRGEVSQEERMVALRQRKKYLKDVFFFDCACIRCRVEEKWIMGHDANLDQKEKKYIQIGVKCANNIGRECFGHYVPPVVQKILGVGNQNENDELWQCVACGHRVKYDER